MRRGDTELRGLWAEREGVGTEATTDPLLELSLQGALLLSTGWLWVR